MLGAYFRILAFRVGAEKPDLRSAGTLALYPEAGSLLPPGNAIALEWAFSRSFRIAAAGLRTMPWVLIILRGRLGLRNFLPSNRSLFKMLQTELHFPWLPSSPRLVQPSCTQPPGSTPGWAKEPGVFGSGILGWFRRQLGTFFLRTTLNMMGGIFILTQRTSPAVPGAGRPC